MSERLTGSVSVGATLTGFIRGPAQLTGSLQIPSAVDVTPYDGPYEVTPRVYAQYLDTDHKLMEDDVTVHEIPVTRTSNLQGGLTVLIG